jgi:hypothetical protein
LDSSLYIVLLASFVSCFFSGYIIWRRRLLQRKGLVFPYFSLKSPETTIEDAVNAFEFEKFVVDKFPRDQFILFYWKGDRLNPQASFNPALEFDYEEQEHRYAFAVECRWFRKASPDGIEWSTHQQIELLKNYQRDSQRTLYVIIGIGGQPSNPSDVYLLPLSKIARHMEILPNDLLKPFRRAEPLKLISYDRQADRLC